MRATAVILVFVSIFTANLSSQAFDKNRIAPVDVEHTHTDISRLFATVAAATRNARSPEFRYVPVLRLGTSNWWDLIPLGVNPEDPILEFLLDLGPETPLN